MGVSEDREEHLRAEKGYLKAKWGHLKFNCGLLKDKGKCLRADKGGVKAITKVNLN